MLDSLFFVFTFFSYVVRYIELKIATLFLNFRSFFADEAVTEQDDRNGQSHRRSRTYRECVVGYSRLVFR